MEKRKALAVSMSGNGVDGRDIVGAAVAARQQQKAALTSTIGRQHAIQWTLDALKGSDSRQATLPPPRAQSAGALVQPDTRSMRPSDGERSRARTTAKQGTSAAAASTTRTLVGTVSAERSAMVRDGPFALYMRKVYAATGVTDPRQVLRRLHHWARTEATVKSQSAQAQRRHDLLVKEHAEVKDKLNAVHSATLVDGGDAGGSSMAGVSSDVQANSSEAGEDIMNRRLDDLSRAKSRVLELEHRAEKKSSALLEAFSSLSNLAFRVERVESALDSKTLLAAEDSKESIPDAAQRVSMSLEDLEPQLMSKLQTCESTLARMLQTAERSQDASAPHNVAVASRASCPDDVHVSPVGLRSTSSNMPHSGHTGWGGEAAAIIPAEQPRPVAWLPYHQNADITSVMCSDDEQTADEACVHASKRSPAARRRGALHSTSPVRCAGRRMPKARVTAETTYASGAVPGRDEVKSSSQRAALAGTTPLLVLEAHKARRLEEELKERALAF